jgi:hypothetical protein
MVASSILTSGGKKIFFKEFVIFLSHWSLGSEIRGSGGPCASCAGEKSLGTWKSKRVGLTAAAREKLIGYKEKFTHQDLCRCYGVRTSEQFLFILCLGWIGDQSTYGLIPLCKDSYPSTKLN